MYDYVRCVNCCTIVVVDFRSLPRSYISMVGHAVHLLYHMYFPLLCREPCTYQMYLLIRQNSSLCMTVVGLSQHSFGGEQKRNMYVPRRVSTMSSCRLLLLRLFAGLSLCFLCFLRCLRARERCATAAICWCTIARFHVFGRCFCLLCILHRS